MDQEILKVSFYDVRCAVVMHLSAWSGEPPLKPSPLTCYKQFGTNSIIVLMFVELQSLTFLLQPECKLWVLHQLPSCARPVFKQTA
jgi:hypothetical protein